jgi:hypothetical protein
MTVLNLWGINPSGYLAGMGLEIIVPGSTTTWRQEDQHAVTTIAAARLVGAVMADVDDCRSSIGSMIGTAERVVATAMAQCQPDVDISGPGTDAEKRRRKRELATWSKHMAAPRLGLDLGSGQMDLVTSAAALAAEITKEDVLEIIPNGIPYEPPGRPLRHGGSLRLSHTDATPYAFRARAPSTSDPLVRVAESWLALRAIIAHPLLGSRWAAPPHPLPHHGRALTWSLGDGFTYRSEIRIDKYGYGSLSPAVAS